MDELGKLMSQMGDKMTKQEAKDMIRLIDRNKDGCVEYKGVRLSTKTLLFTSQFQTILSIFVSEFFSIVTRK